MSKQFESEIRIRIENIDEFLKKLRTLNAKVIYSYKFSDHLYYPKNPTSDWNPNIKTMRIREHIWPERISRILFSENNIITGKTFQFKQSKYPAGKIELYKGDQTTAEALLLSWDFRFRYKIEKMSGKLFEIIHPQKFVIAVEQIAQLGHSAEIELWGKDLIQIEKKFLDAISLLEIPLNNVTSNSLPYIMADSLHFLD